MAIRQAPWSEIFNEPRPVVTKSPERFDAPIGYNCASIDSSGNVLLKLLARDEIKGCISASPTNRQAVVRYASKEMELVR